MGNYVTAASLRTFKINGCEVSDQLCDYQDAELEVDIVLAEEVIEDYTRDIFYSKTETNLFDGNGLTRFFFFPEIKYQIISVTTVKELDLDGTTVLDTFVEDVDFKTYPNHLETALQVDGDSPRRRFGTGGIWPKGQNNIEVAGSWGKSSTPAAITRATILLVLEDILPGSTGMIRGDAVEAEWDDFRVELNPIDGSDASTGWDKVDRLLRPHINYVSMFISIPDTKQTYDNV